MLKKIFILAALAIGATNLNALCEFPDDDVVASTAFPLAMTVGTSIGSIQVLDLCKHYPNPMTNYKISFCLLKSVYFVYSQATTVCAATAFAATTLTAAVDLENNTEVVDRNFAFNVIEAAF